VIETEGMGVSMMDVVCIIVTEVADLFNVEVMQFLYLLADSKKERRKGRDGEKIKIKHMERMYRDLYSGDHYIRKYLS
jgi:hypothetical protein